MFLREILRELTAFWNLIGVLMVGNQFYSGKLDFVQNILQKVLVQMQRIAIQLLSLQNQIVDLMNLESSQ